MSWVQVSKSCHPLLSCLIFWPLFLAKLSNRYHSAHAKSEGCFTLAPKVTPDPNVQQLRATNKTPFAFPSTVIQRPNSFGDNCGDRVDLVVICSIRSITAASTYLGDYGNIRAPYTTSVNISMTRSSSLFSMMYLSRKSHGTHSLFPFCLVMGTKTFASIFIICANFFLNETFFDFFQKILSGFDGDILSRTSYYSTVGVKSS